MTSRCVAAEFEQDLSNNCRCYLQIRILLHEIPTVGKHCPLSSHVYLMCRMSEMIYHYCFSEVNNVKSKSVNQTKAERRFKQDPTWKICFLKRLRCPWCWQWVIGLLCSPMFGMTPKMASTVRRLSSRVLVDPKKITCAEVWVVPPQRILERQCDWYFRGFSNHRRSWYVALTLQTSTICQG